MKTNFNELIKAAESLSSSLDKASENENEFPFRVCVELERLSWEIFRAANTLKEIKEYVS